MNSPQINALNPKVSVSSLVLDKKSRYYIFYYKVLQIHNNNSFVQLFFKQINQF